MTLTVLLLATVFTLFRASSAGSGFSVERRLLPDGWHGIVARESDKVARDLGTDFFPVDILEDGRVAGFVTVEDGHDVLSVTPTVVDAVGRRSAWTFAPPADELLARYSRSRAGSASAAPGTAHVVCVDPGHGGTGAAQWNGVNGDGAGAHGPGGLTEQWVNLRVSQFLMDYLNADPRFAGSFRTRTAETQVVSLVDRVALAAQGGASLFVSVHHNALPAGAPNRTETYYCFRNATCSLPALWTNAAWLAHDEVADAFGYVRRGALEDSSGSGRFHFYVLRYSAMPSTLCEASNLNEDVNEENLFGRDPFEAHARDEARALYRAILRYYGYATTGVSEAGETRAAGIIFGTPETRGRQVTVSYEAREATRYRLVVEDVAGRRVRGLPDIEGPSRGLLVWDGRTSTGVSASAGAYWITALAGSRGNTVARATRVVLLP